MQPSGNDNEFRLLKKLLALKRHENPPPGYFGNFSSKVTARLRAAEETRQPDTSYWRWLLRGFEWRTALVGVYAVSFIGLIAAGIYLGTKAGRENVASQPPPKPAPVLLTGGDGAQGGAFAQKPAAATSNSTAPNFLFDPPNGKTAPTGFQPEKK